MPAIITHDTFGQDVYAKLYHLIGGSRQEAEAFLLGNQGPDPLFYAVASPRVAATTRLGSIMHDKLPNETLVAFKRAVAALPARDRGIGRAYLMGFLCHYLLDATVHPFVYSQQFAICDAGVEGLTRKDGSDVHAVIESEIDEVVLTVKRGETIATFKPSRHILKADDRTLDVISAMYVQMAREVYAIDIPANAYKLAVKAFRRVQGLFYSPSGLKHNVIGRIEMLVRPYSFYRAMSHRNREIATSPYLDDEHETWTDPFTGEQSRMSFWDLYESALARASVELARIDAAPFTIEQAREITGDRNFSGDVTYARIVNVEDAD